MFSKKPYFKTPRDDILSGTPGEDGGMALALARLRAMPPETASRNLAWRLLDAFATDNSEAFVFWTLACAVYHNWHPDQQTLAEFVWLMGKRDENLI